MICWSATTKSLCFTICLCLRILSVATSSEVQQSDVPFENKGYLENREEEAAAALLRRRLTAETDDAYQQRLETHNPLFHFAKEVEVLGPTGFPKPTDRVPKTADDDVELVPFLKPKFGKHRPDKDAVFAYASEYKLDNYVLFVHSLQAAGFDGDIVLSVSELDIANQRVLSFLQGVPNLVLYVPKMVCFNFENEEVASAKGGIRTCQCHELYGRRTTPNGPAQAIEDPRAQRTIATIRYEIYWIWAQNYNPSSWILLVDARDTYFQTNPFADVPRKTDPSGRSGLLYFFGENVEATRLGKSKSNAKWIQTAYGDFVSKALAEKPTICSGATMGEQMAIETYTRALVAEADDTGTVLMGADQGFHNFLYYSNKLKNAERIHDIVVFDQGTGIVNNMGAMRTKPLEEWGNGKIVKKVAGGADGQANYQILNWDGTISPVVHQFDRHKVLSEYFFKKKAGEFIEAWRLEKGQ